LVFAALLPVSYLLLRSSEVTDLSQISVRSAMWNSEKWISLPVSHHSSPTVSIGETTYEIHVGISLIFKSVRYFDHLTELQFSQTAASQDSTKLVTRLHCRSTSSEQVRLIRYGAETGNSLLHTWVSKK
jgi:hypothetical protein